ncbi:MAG TPA: class I SAM-dependent methyltransferase [Bryobacteraceae bacterium]|jgi:ubiquinone/menaquinone biosynthesis C-methylase UbiE|nr:class I SAM-dependent methyltransferase [Bryobacteraceae bacterium]
MKIGRLAPWYRWIEYAAFGRALERRRFSFLDRVAGAKRILILGEGDGRVLSRLLAAAPQAQIDVVEVSPEMIELAHGRTGHSQQVRFLCQDARTLELPAHTYDAVLTMFFLDCFSAEDAALLIRRIAVAMKPEALWLLSEFSLPHAGWRRWHAQAWIGTMYFFFRVATGLQARKLPPIAKLLAESGMRAVEHQQSRAGLMISEVHRLGSA